MRVALAQLPIEGGAVAANTDRAVDAIADAADRGADLVVLPEIFNVGYFAFDSYARQAEPLDGETLTRVRGAARDHGVGVLAGSIVEDLDATTAAETPTESGLANTSVLFDRDGERLLVYRKHHLFGYGSAEQELLTPGERLPTAEFGGFTIAPSTCYDLRFPELYRELAEKGSTLVLVPSAWPYPRVEHWQVLSRARAIENLTYFATVNGAADFEEATLLGRSTIHDPWGTVLASAGDEPTLVSAEITPERVTDIRDEFPAWQDRR